MLARELPDRRNADSEKVVSLAVLARARLEEALKEFSVPGIGERPELLRYFADGPMFHATLLRVMTGRAAGNSRYY